MNWDTHEIRMIIESDIKYYTKLQEAVGNELYFMVMLYIIIGIENEKENSPRIDPAEVNGNEVYISFCEAVGNETEGWK